MHGLATMSRLNREANDREIARRVAAQLQEELAAGNVVVTQGDGDRMRGIYAFRTEELARRFVSEHGSADSLQMRVHLPHQS